MTSLPYVVDLSPRRFVALDLTGLAGAAGLAGPVLAHARLARHVRSLTGSTAQGARWAFILGALSARLHDNDAALPLRVEAFIPVTANYHRPVTINADHRDGALVLDLG